MNSELYALLADRGSLTQRFEQMMGVKPTLTRLKQGREMVPLAERQILSIPDREFAMVREIKMAKVNQDWMYARTVIPHSTLQGAARRLAHLKDAPIGKILFGRHGAIRKSLQISTTCEFPKRLAELGVYPEHPLWQRQSIFEFDSGPLLITELFLPDCPIYTDGVLPAM